MSVATQRRDQHTRAGCVYTAHARLGTKFQNARLRVIMILRFRDFDTRNTQLCSFLRTATTTRLAEGQRFKDADILSSSYIYFISEDRERIAATTSHHAKEDK
jgi:hypothetical protein